MKRERLLESLGEVEVEVGGGGEKARASLSLRYTQIPNEKSAGGSHRPWLFWV